MYVVTMDTNNTLPAVLWGNVLALMTHAWGQENQNRPAREARIGPATVARMKKQGTSIGLDVLAAVADVFGAEPWQLLVPTFDPADPPARSPLTTSQAEAYAVILRAARGDPSKG